MNVFLYTPLLCAIALALCADLIITRAPPRSGSATLIAAALTVAVAADIGLVVLVAARLLDAAPLATLLAWPPETSAPIPVPVPISLIAAAALAAAAVAGWADWRRTRKTMQQLRTMHAHAPAGELIVLRSPTVLAHALPASGEHPGRILVSDSMLRALEPDERRVLLAHERSHLHHRHDRYRRLVRIAARIHPLLRPTISVVDYLLERWADEDAARATGNRTLTARALARAAVHQSAVASHPQQPTFAAQGVSSRMNALLGPQAPTIARLALVLPALIAITATLTGIAALHELAHLYAILRGHP